MTLSISAWKEASMMLSETPTVHQRSVVASLQVEAIVCAQIAELDGDDWPPPPLLLVGGGGDGGGGGDDGGGDGGGGDGGGGGGCGREWRVGTKQKRNYETHFGVTQNAHTELS